MHFFFKLQKYAKRDVEIANNQSIWNKGKKHANA